MTDNVLPVVLLYDEPEWTERVFRCLEAAGFKQPFATADRDGVGSMSKAFNEAVQHSAHRIDKYVWFLTNVTFPPELPAALYETLEADPACAAVHPAFDSDHPHIKNAARVDVVPFIEWTAPMIRLEALDDVGLLDTAMPYVHFDLDWSRRALDSDWRLKVDGRYRLEHTYLWKDAPHPISRFRRELRALRHDASVARMREKWGDDWMKKLCPTGTCG